MMMMMMGMKEESGWGPRVCDTCRSTASAVYCRSECMYMCGPCDARVHGGAWGHERVKVCEACERSPAALLCKADAASLCAPCDAAVHSANPLARRHHRVPILALPQGEEEDATWLAPGREVDEYLDLMEYGGGDDLPALNVGDSVVPCGNDATAPASTPANGNDDQLGFHLGVFHDASPKPAYAYNNIAHSSTVSISSMEMSIVPDSAMSETPMSHSRPPKGTIDLFSGQPVQIPAQLNPLDREARVLRYREKKKNRKFEKTIRYASRKAYAETRPRIKGRFAKRTEVEVDVDHMFSAALMGDNGYGIVPSFQ